MVRHSSKCDDGRVYLGGQYRRVAKEIERFDKAVTVVGVDTGSLPPETAPSSLQTQCSGSHP